MYKKLAIIIALLFISLKSEASHLAGGYLSYECLGSGDYIFELVFYADESGINLPVSVQIMLEPVNPTGNSYNFLLLQESNEPISITPSIPCFSYNGNTFYFQNYTFKSDIVTIPGGTSYHVYHQSGPEIGLCCRNTPIDNVQSPEELSQVHYMYLPDPALYPCNSGPQFDTLPFTTACKDLPLFMDHSVIDTNGDSVSYRFCEALTGDSYSPTAIPPFPSVPYASGYSGANPITGNPNITIDSLTGIITGTPNQQGIYLFKVCVDEFRNDTIIGRYGKEFELSVINCNTIQSSVNTNYDNEIASCNLTIQFEANSPATNHIWQFDYPNGQDTSHQKNPTYTYPDTGTYTAMYIAEPDAPCVDTVFTEVVIKDPFNHPFDLFEINGPAEICPGKKVEIEATGANSYEWLIPNVQCDSCPTQQVAPDSTTTYYAEGSEFGCYELDSITIQPYPVLVNIFDIDSVAKCGYDSVQLQILEGENPQWEFSYYLTCLDCPEPNAFPVNDTWFYVEVEDPVHGCVTKDSIYVEVQSYPSVSVFPKDTSLCLGDSVTLHADANAYSYNWSNGGTLSTTVVSPDSTTDFVVTASTSAGCSTKDTSTVSINFFQEGNLIGDTSMCMGDSVQLYATGYESVQWSPATYLSGPASAEPFAYPPSTTSFQAALQDMNGCLDTTLINFNVWMLPTITTSGDISLCNGDTTLLQAQGGDSYQWKPNSNIECKSCNATSAYPNSSTLYQVTVTDTNGCVAHDSIEIDVYENPVVNIVSEDTICEGQDLTLEVFSNAHHHTWSTGDTGTSITVSPVQNTSYTVTAMDSIGCKTLDTAHITVSVLQPGSFINDTSMCLGDTVQLFAEGFQSYSWSPGNTLNDSVVSMPYAFPNNTTTYTVIAQSLNGCHDTGQINLTVNPLPNITTSPDTAICNGDTATIQAHGGSTYQWNPGNKLSCDSCQSTSIYVDSTTTIYVTGSNNKGCTDTSIVEITVNELPLVNLYPADTTICQGDTIPLIATGAATYQWIPAPAIPPGDTFLVAPGSSTSYTVEGIDSNGCQRSDNTIVFVDEYVDVYGQVQQSNGNPLGNSSVYLIVFDQGSNSYVAIDSTETDMNGNYEFETKEDEAYIKVVPDSAAYPKQLTTYYDSSLVASNASAIQLNACDSVEASFATINEENTGIFHVKDSKFAATIYPNPAKDQLTVQWKATKPGPIRYTMYNALGQIERQGITNQKVFSLDVANIAGGIYIIKLGVGQESAIHKVVIE